MSKLAASKQAPVKAAPVTTQPLPTQPTESKLSEVRSTSVLSQKDEIKSQPTQLDLQLKSHFESFILKPSHIAKLWESSRMKEDLIKIFQDFFKPKSSIEQEKVEYNEINIFAEFQLYNLIFAKNELLFDNYKTSVLLNLFWKLLEFNTETPQSEDNTYQRDRIRNSNRLSPSGSDHIGGMESPTRLSDNQNIRYVGEGLEDSSETKFANLLQHKFGLFKRLLFECLNQSEKALAFNPEEVKRILDYAKDTYFKHLRLYDYVLNNKQLCEVKRLQKQMNVPVIAANLSEALLLGAEEQLGYEDEDEELRLQIQKKQQEFQERQQLEADQLLRDHQEMEQAEESDEEMKDVDERVKQSNLDRETKLIIHQKISTLDTTLQKTILEKQKALDDKILATQAKKK